MSKTNQAPLQGATLLLRKVIVALGSALIFSSTAATASTTLSGTSNSACPPIAAAISQAANNVYTNAQNTYAQVPQPQNLSASTCFSNIFNMGSSIGLSFFNPSTILQQLEQMVCNAAQQALQWPLQQANNTVNQYGQLPYGMGGITSQQSATPGVSVGPFTSSSPYVGNIPTGNSNTLSSALGG